MKTPLALIVLLGATLSVTAHAAPLTPAVQGCENLNHTNWQGVVILTNNQLVPISVNVTQVEAGTAAYSVQGTLRYHLNQTDFESSLIGACINDANQTIRALFLHNDNNNDKFEAGHHTWNRTRNILLNLDGAIGGQPFYNGQVFH